MVDSKKSFIANVQNLSEAKKAVIFFTAFSITAVVTFFVGAYLTHKNFSLIGSSLKSIDVSTINVMPDEPLEKVTVTDTPKTEGADFFGFASEEEMANWKTYTSTQYGFALKFPLEWFIDDTKNDVVYISPQSPDDRQLFEYTALQITMTKVGKDAVVETEIEKQFPEMEIKKAETDIGSEHGYIVETPCDSPTCGWPQWFLLKNSTLYRFDPGPEYQGVFESILSTFRFIK